MTTSPIEEMSGEQLAMIEKIGDQFAIAGEFVKGEVVNGGLINPTFRATYKRETGVVRRYILQKINDTVFPDPLKVIRNVETVTRHINWKVMRVKKSMGGQTLNMYPARGGKCYATGEGGGVWRCYNYIEGCRTYDVVENTRQAYQAAHAFGAFQDLVSDLDPADVEETIEGFHDTRKRYDALMVAVAENASGRLDEVTAELAFIKEREKEVGVLLDFIAEGKIPVRVTHNDTKLNNVMIDAERDEAVCVIDLDTVMPGLSLYDFGDLVRTATSPAEEDETDLSKVEMRMPMFEALAEGFLDSAGGFMNDLEVEHMAFSGKLMTLEVGIRFLTDFLNGDHYFKTQYPTHNLDRCRNQLKLVESIEEQEGAMNDFVKALRAKKA